MLLIDPAALDHLTDRATIPLLHPPKALLERARLLPDDDRLLVELALKHRLPVRAIGSIVGLEPGNVTRKLRRLVNRLHDPLVAALSNDACGLPDQQRQVAISYFLHRRPIAQIARQHRLTVRRVSATIEFVRGWHRGLSTPR